MDTRVRNLLSRIQSQLSVLRDSVSLWQIGCLCRSNVCWLTACGLLPVNCVSVLALCVAWSWYMHGVIEWSAVVRPNATTSDQIAYTWFSSNHVSNNYYLRMYFFYFTEVIWWKSESEVRINQAKCNTKNDYATNALPYYAVFSVKFYTVFFV